MALFNYVIVLFMRITIIHSKSVMHVDYGVTVYMFRESAI